MIPRSSEPIPIPKPANYQAMDRGNDSASYTDHAILSMSPLKLLSEIELDMQNPREVERMTAVLKAKIKMIKQLDSFISYVRQESHPLAQLMLTVCQAELYARRNN